MCFHIFQLLVNVIICLSCIRIHLFCISIAFRDQMKSCAQVAYRPCIFDKLICSNDCLTKHEMQSVTRQHIGEMLMQQALETMLLQQALETMLLQHALVKGMKLDKVKTWLISRYFDNEGLHNVAMPYIFNMMGSNFASNY